MFLFSRPPAQIHQKQTCLINLCSLGNRALYPENFIFYFDEFTFVIYSSYSFRKYILFWGFRKTSDHKAKRRQRMMVI